MKKFKLTDVEGKEFILEVPEENLDFVSVRIRPVEPPAPEIKEGMWVVGKNGARPFGVALCTSLECGGLIAYFDNFMGDTGRLSWRNFMRPATPAEIESHLKKVCEKYIGKKVKCLTFPERGIFTINGRSFAYWPDDDKFVDELNSDSQYVPTIYWKGQFAEIIEDKKKRPETMDEFCEMLTGFDSLPDGYDYIDFLKNTYNI